MFDQDLWNQLSKDCRNNIQKFNWDYEQVKLLQLYNNISNAK